MIQQCYKNYEIATEVQQWNNHATVTKQRRYCKVFAWREGKGWEEGEDFYLLKGQLKAITPFFVIITRNGTVNINLYFIETPLKSCSVAENKSLT